MKKSVILSSIMLIALCLSLITGATFALFTSESSVNIAVSSGKVELVANIEDLETWSLEDDYTVAGRTDGSFTLGGKAEVTGGNVKLDKIVPGDKVKFNVAGTNNSNITIQYRISVQAKEAYKLLEGLKISIAGAQYSSLYSYKTAWATLKAGETFEDVEISMELPEEAGNEYQDLTANLVVLVEAIQGNAEVEGEAEVVSFALVDSAEELKNAFAVNSRSVETTKKFIVLNNDIELDANEPIVAAANNEFELNLNGHNISGVSTEIGKNRAIFAVKGVMEVTGEGTISHKHNAENMGWGNLTAAFSVEGGELTLNEGVKVVNAGGTNMAYGVDVNTTLGKSVLNINGAEIISTYTAVRLFNNHSTQLAIVNYNAGLVAGGSRDIWAHNPSAKAVDANAIVNISDEFNYEITVQTASYNGRIYQFEGGFIPATDPEKLDSSLANGEDVVLLEDVLFNASETTANSGYGATGVSVKGGSLDGNGNTLTVTGASGTWDTVVHTTGGTIKNLVAAGAMRGIFMGSATGDVYIDNVSFNTIYTFNSDGGSKEYGVYISNSTMNGWTSYSDAHKEVVFDNCKFTEGCGYAFLRAYNNTEFKNCVFDASVGFELQVVSGAIATFENCYYGDILITAENIAELGLLYETNISLVVVK